MLTLLLCSMLLLDTKPTAADDTWPEWRGGALSALRRETRLPTTWSKNQNVAWVAAVPGTGWASPIVWKDRVFLTTVVGEAPKDKDKPQKGLYMGGERPAAPSTPHRWLAHAFDASTGKVLWEKELHQGLPKFGKHIKNTYASETPVTDGDRLYVYLGEVGVFCLDFDGNILWKQLWPVMPTKATWGFGASPVLHGDRLFIVNDNEKESFLVALDKKTGKELWRVKRDEKSNWSTPIIWRNSQRTELITTGTNKVRSYDLDGKLLWELGSLSKVTVMSPVADGDLLYVGSGFLLDRNRPLFAVRPGASGDISLKKDQTSSDYVVWMNPTASVYHPTPLVVDGLIYILNDRGLLSAYDAKTGALVYEKKRVVTSGAGAFTASPVAFDGKILCVSEDGETYVVQAGPDFKVLGKNSLEEFTLATPAFTKDRLFLRTATKLYCIAKTE